MTAICEVCGEEIDLDTQANHYDDFGVWLGICDDCIRASKHVDPQDEALKDRARGAW